jgi:puromycin-sensitive aminopeptidase
VSELPYEADPNLRVVKFDRTPIMSTYLVAYVVGEFDYVEERSADGVLVRCYTPVGKKEQGRFGLYVAAKVLPYYKEYFGVEYPLPKMDLVAVADFAACNLIHFNIIPSPFSLNALRCHLLGVMENRGLVTYRETCLVVDEQNTSTQRRQWVAIVLGHELAHQYGSAKMSRW